MIGPVHEKETNASVKAMKKRLIRPEVLSTLLSILLVHDAGSTSSNAPRKDMAKTSSNAKKIRLNTALVAILLSALAPKMAVIIRPNATYIKMIEAPYRVASATAFLRTFLFL